jgi:hypothetical protein
MEEGGGSPGEGEVTWAECARSARRAKLERTGRPRAVADGDTPTPEIVAARPRAIPCVTCFAGVVTVLWAGETGAGRRVRCPACRGTGRVSLRDHPTPP